MAMDHNGKENMEIMCSELNYIQFMFFSFTSITIVASIALNLFEKKLPNFIKRTIRYGKYASDVKCNFIKQYEVPKFWFKHFYLFGALMSVVALYYVIKSYIFGYYPPEWLNSFLNFNFGISRQASVSKAHVMLAMSLMTLQCLRRFYETHFVSIFRESCRINIVHYCMGLMHYYGAILAILSEAPVFSKSNYRAILQFEDLKWIDALATAVFLWAWYHQYICTKILANLRKNSRGKVVTQEHKLPYGDWFQYVSSPHFFAEKLMYVCLAVILRGNVTWLYVLAWVICNQVETALLSHWWYQEHFRGSFPRRRKAVLPFIY